MTITSIQSVSETKDTEKSVSLPDNIYQTFLNESEKTEQAKNSLSFLETIKIVNNVKQKVNVLHESLKKKSNIFIFGAGGTTSWFLPKLLKIYNDAFLKVPELRYDLNIVLIDADQVRL